jgi:prepilin-type N-terminal cleavage/methylation domain-containing protein
MTRYVPKKRIGKVLIKVLPILSNSAKVSSHCQAPSGFTLIESLVAALVVGILMASIAPMLVLTTASRAQVRRVDRAAQEAKSYAEGVKAGVIPTPNQFTTDAYNKFCSFAPNTLPTDPGTLIDSVGSVQASATPDVKTVNGLVIQAVRTGAGLTQVQLNQQGYNLIIRVYRGDAFSAVNISPYSIYTSLPAATSDKANYLASPSTVPHPNFEPGPTFTGSLGRPHRPLAVLRTNVQYNLDFQNQTIGLALSPSPYTCPTL